VQQTKTKLVRGGPKFGKVFHKQLEATLPLPVWTQLMKRMVELIVEEVLTNPLGFMLPKQLGMLVVVKSKLPSTKVYRDLIHFSKTGETKKQLNLHTFGHFFRIKWVHLQSTNLPFKTVWTFKACRAVNRALAKHIFSGQTYFTLDNTGRINR